MSSIIVIIPAYNEEKGIQKVLKEIPKTLVEKIIVINNGSTDNTASVSKKLGAIVLEEPCKGYGNACLKGLEYVAAGERKPDIIVFIDADHSDYPEQMYQLVEPIIKNQADLVIGSRVLGKKAKGSMTPQQIFGNQLATFLLKKLYKVNFTDLGPFRAIRYSSLVELNMEDRNFGWTVEMQVKAAKLGINSMEVPVDYRKRIGKSKVSGTVKGTILAGHKILYTIFKHL